MDNEDELDHLSNVCADLMSLKRLEPALVHLFRDRPAGAWVPVRELYESAGTASDDIPSSVSAAWLPSPVGNSGYAVVSFYDDDLKWSMSAVYNTARLLKASRPATAAVTTDPASRDEQADSVEAIRSLPPCVGRPSADVDV